MLNTKRSAGLRQKQESSIGSFTAQKTVATNASEEKLGAACHRFESWAQTMTSGRFQAAWRLNDCCGMHWPSAHRLWDGQSLRGVNLVVHAKHGLGDAVQMLQYTQRLRGLCANIDFDVAPSFQSLLPYFKCVGPEGAISPVSSEPHSSRTVEVEIMELPYMFRTTQEDLPLAIDYLTITEEISLPYLSCMGWRRKPRIGIVWAGGEWDRGRWVPLNLLKHLITDDSYEWWNLQGGSAAAEANELPMKKITRSGDEGLVALAATISNLDLMITVDTLAAHLAAAIGKPTWLMLKYDADWRWLRGRDDSPWYPSLRLFRQSSAGDWRGVIRSLEAALEERRF